MGSGEAMAKMEGYSYAPNEASLRTFKHLFPQAFDRWHTSTAYSEWTIPMRIFSLMFCAALVLAGCASVPKGDAGQEAALKQFMPKPGLAGIYVYRKEDVGGFSAMEVHLDGRNIGRIADKTFLFAEVAPGRHVVTGKAGDKPVPGVEFNAVPGKLYYVKQETRFGGLLASGSRLIRVDDIEAQHALRKMTLAAGQAASPP